MKQKDTYSCLHCDTKNHVYLSIWPPDFRGTLTCSKCGETEDAKDGITRNGKKIESFRRYNRREISNR